MRSKNLLVRIKLLLWAFLFSICCFVSVGYALPEQVDIDNAGLAFDANGIPLQVIEGRGKVYSPSFIAASALAYAGEIPVFKKQISPDRNKFILCADWLLKNLNKLPNGKHAWVYDFDHTYNDISIKAPWYSAYGQAVGIEALLSAYSTTKKKAYLDAARRAADILFTSLDEGGLLFSKNGATWFEVMPSPIDNPPHILNGHQRVLLVLKKLADVTNDATVRNWWQKGLNTLVEWMPKYDAGYWLRYDLNPRKKDLLFRFVNPYGEKLTNLAIDSIVLSDPETGKSTSLDLGSVGDTKGPGRFAGINWGQREKLDGRTVRRLHASLPVNSPEKIVRGAPHTYFYMALPETWRDNLRDSWCELTITYKDQVHSNIAVQMRSIAPGMRFQDMRDGDLFLTGSGKWRSWKIAVRPSDLGYFVGKPYAKKHVDYLKKLAANDPRLESWAYVAEGYYNAIVGDSSKVQVKAAKVEKLPAQTPVLPLFSLDKNAVLLQHVAGEDTRIRNGVRDEGGNLGTQAYSPYIVAEQAAKGHLFFNDFKLMDPRNVFSHEIIKKYDILVPNETKRVKRGPALRWLVENGKEYKRYNARMWFFDVDNSYNDVVSKAPWQSSFPLPFIVDAFKGALKCKEPLPRFDYEQLLNETLNAYKIPIEDKGIVDFSRFGPFFEEVPNATHVLNAHLVGINILRENNRYGLSRNARNTIRNAWHMYDTGYWVRYDANPKKTLLLNIDWLKGETAPYIGNIQLVNPATMTAVELDAAKPTSFEGAIRLSGSDWSVVKEFQGKNGRTFRNGYSVHSEPLKGGTRHNVYVVAPLPEKSVPNHFDWPVHILRINYFDNSPGGFGVGIQDISQGDFLKFSPLRHAIIKCTGDKTWKTIDVQIRPQDCGWYVGIDYQNFHLEQLRKQAELYDDWYISQAAERLNWYIGMHKKGSDPIASSLAYKDTTPENAALPIAANTPENAASSAKIIAASPTYDGFGLENALDEKPNDDYTAMLEGQVPQGFTLDLGRFCKIVEIEINFESKNNYAKDFRIESTDYSRVLGKGIVYDTIADVKGNTKKVWKYRFNRPVGATFLRFLTTELEGQPRLLLRQFKVMVEPPTILQRLLLDTDGDLVSISDPTMTKPQFLLFPSISKSIKRIAESVVKGRALTDHEKVVELMRLNSSHEIGILDSAYPKDALLDQIGACGSWANLQVALLTSIGIKSRYIGLYNYPESDGHVVIEAFIDGRWQLYDPTFGSFYTTEPDNLHNPYVLSYAELRKGMGRSPEVKHVILHKKRATENPHAVRLYTEPSIFENANPAGVLGVDNFFEFPLFMDALHKTIIDPKISRAQNQGSGTIGKSYFDSGQKVMITNLTPGSHYALDVTYTSLIGRNVSSIKVKAKVGDASGSFFDEFLYTKGDMARTYSIPFVPDKSSIVIRLRADVPKGIRACLGVSKYKLSLLEK